MMKKYKADKKCLIAIQTGTLIVAAVLTALAGYVSQSFAEMSMVGCFLAVIWAFFALIYMPLYFSALSYTATDSELKAEWGILIRQSRTIRFDTVQYTSDARLRLIGGISVNTLTFYVYGGHLGVTFLSTGDTDEILARSGFKK